MTLFCSRHFENKASKEQVKKMSRSPLQECLKSLEASKICLYDRSLSRGATVQCVRARRSNDKDIKQQKTLGKREERQETER